MTKKGFIRKETIERIFCTVKEHHEFRYTLMRGKTKMEMKDALTVACVNIKKLVKIMARKSKDIFDLLHNYIKILEIIDKNKKLGYVYIY